MAPQPKINVVDLFKLWRSELSPAEICARLNISRSQLTRLQQQHKLPKKPITRSRQQPVDPTPEEIALRALEEQKNWSEAERESRRVGPRRTGWQIPAFTYDRRNFSFSSANVME
jgi:hypothetical protein